ncbi:hypothetical protein PQO03_08150 [Lentisphaera profundi]|uniref:O-antigen ligase-related domain-containing protein n=1 Tax=Lentisphaera profundi TaxID=1658616 RepID=A0ABY7VP09_9BACT|nr:O-antigen ligase family protein [Lentisphaera profundi]WDE95687.1 hypothetical protein PQO03_08150 [Lentisphaera profundi]
MSEPFKNLKLAEKSLIIGVSILLFLSPLYFGLNFGQNAVELSPLDLYSWIYAAAWPSQILTISALLCLVLAIVTYPQRLVKELKQVYFFVPWFVLLLALLPGGIQTTEKAFLNQYISHVVGVLALALSAWIAVNQRPRTRLIFMGAIFFGACKSIYNGLYQYFYGFSQNVQMIEQSNNVNLGDFKGRAQETLLYADFVLSNSYAAHLILIFGLFLYMARHILQSFVADKKRLMLWSLIAIIPLCTCLLLTKSRGGIMAFVAASVITYALSLSRKKCLMTLGLLVLVVALSAPILFNIPSVIVRSEYARVGFEMFKNNPMGAGMGEFRNDYLLHKIPGAEGTILPHNMLNTMIGQCGISGLLASLLFIASFIYLVKILDKDKWSYNHFIFWGLLAWFIHAQLDFNFFIPGTLLTFAVMLTLIKRPCDEEYENLSNKVSVGINISLLCLCACVFLFVKDMYSLHRFSLSHDRFFGSSLIDYRFIKIGNLNLRNCDYCLETLEQDDLAYCVSCGVLGDPNYLSAEQIVAECEVLDELMERPDIWRMASKKLLLMYYRQKTLQSQGMAVNAISMEQYLLEAERSMFKAIASEPRYGMNYISLAELQFQRNKQADEVMASLRKGLQLAPDSRRGHNLLLKYGEYYRKLGKDFRKDLIISHLMLQEISLAPMIMSKRQNKKYSSEQEAYMIDLSGKLKQLGLFLVKEFQHEKELLNRYEKVKTLLEQLKERV